MGNTNFERCISHKMLFRFLLGLFLVDSHDLIYNGVAAKQANFVFNCDFAMI